MASKGGGRKRDLAWSYFGVKVSKRIERIKTQLSKCSKKIKLDKQAQASTSQN